MTSLNIQQGNTSESVSPTVIDKLYRLALLNTNEGSPLMSLSGYITPSAAYEDAVIYLRSKFPDLTIDINIDDCYIRFKDYNVKYILLNAGIGDTVGITKSQASVANPSRTLFNGNTSIVNFNEFPLFTRCQSNAMQFNNCTNLESIDLGNVTTLWLSSSAYMSFKGCSKLRSIGTLPEGITIIPTEFVRNCSLLLSINIPSTCTHISSAAFGGASLLTFSVSDLTNIISFEGNIYSDTFPPYSISGDTLNLPNCTTLASLVFKQQNFKKVLLPSLTTWSRNESRRTFMQCTQLKEVYMPNYRYSSDFDYNDNGPFRECSSLEKVTISNLATGLIAQMFSGGASNLKYINIPETIVNIGYEAFNGANQLTGKILNLPAATTIKNMAFRNTSGMHIYVPALTSTPVCEGVYNNDPNMCWLGYRNETNKTVIRTLYFKNITSFGAGSFNSAIVDNIIINNTTPPTLTQHTNTTLESRDADFNVYVFHGLANASSVNIYVPDSAVATYQAAPQFADVATRIKPLSDSSLHHITASEILERDEDGTVEYYDDNGVQKPLYGYYCTVDGIIDDYAI